MPFKVRVRNFQSLGDVTVEVSGLTVLTGPNNSGKSALVRAVYGAFTNTKGTDFVRRGTDSAQVDLTFSDGRTLTWEKGKKANRYELDGKALERVGMGTPEAISTLGVYPVEASGRELWPQFAHQFLGQIFLLQEPGSVLAEAIADVAKVGVLNEALRLSQSDRRTSATRLKAAQEEVSANEQKLAGFDGLDRVAKEVQDLEEKDARIQKIRRVIEDLRGLRTRLHAAQEIVSGLSPIRGLGEVNPELVSRVKKTQAALEWVRTSSVRLAKSQEEVERVRALLPKEGSYRIPDSSSLRQEGEDLATLRALSVKYRAAREVVRDLREKLAGLEAEIQSASSHVSSLFAESGSCPYCGANHEDPSRC